MGQLLLFICMQNPWLSRGEPGLSLVLVLNLQRLQSSSRPLPKSKGGKLQHWNVTKYPICILDITYLVIVLGG